VTSSNGHVSSLVVMPDPLSITSGVASLAAILAQLIIRAYSLRGILKEFDALASSLQTLKDVLDRIEREYTESLKVIDSDSRVGPALSRSIDECRTTCEKIDEVLGKIQKAVSRHIRGSIEESTIKGLLRRLERDKSTLKLLMDTITYDLLFISKSFIDNITWRVTNVIVPREERQRRQHQSSQGQLIRTESAPPSYSESTAVVRPTNVRAQTEIERIPRNMRQLSHWEAPQPRNKIEAPLTRRQRPQSNFQPQKEIETPRNRGQLSQWSEPSSDYDELYSTKNKWSSKEESPDEPNDSDEGALYSVVASTRSFFSLAYGVKD
jgi:hypothetical protein